MLKNLKNNFKKKNNFTKYTAVAILAFSIVSCGGGGGGGGSTTGSSTPVAPSNPIAKPVIPPSSGPSQTTTPAVPASGPIAWNDSSVSYDKNNQHSHSDTTYTGSGAKVGIIDVGFENSSLASDLSSKFGSRLHKLTVSGFTATPTQSDDHGVVVASFLGSATEGTAKNVEIYAIDAAKQNNEGKTYPEISLSMYQALQNNGVKIYNQSFGVDSDVTKFSPFSTDVNYYGTQIGTDVLTFYKNAVANGSLFVWSAGNDSTDKNPSLEASLPYFENTLQKGWINVVSLTSKKDSDLGNTSWDNLTALTPAGVAKNWTVTVVGDQIFEIKGQRYVGSGSSYAAPVVTGTAALLKEKYPWMDGSLIRQTILSTATDIGDPGVDSTYGWGLINIDKALNGPSKFSKELALDENVVVDIPSGTYTFSNDISGDAGLIKNGAGILILSGNSTFTGNTTVNAGKVQVNGVYTSSLNVRPQATLATRNAVIQNDVTNAGTVENTGRTTFAGKYISLENSRIKTDTNSTLHVAGDVKLNNVTVEVAAKDQNGQDKYVTAKGITNDVITSDGTVEGTVKGENERDLINVDVQRNGNKVTANLSRKNVETYVKDSENSDEMQQNTAANIETAFQKLDEEVENGNTQNVENFERKAAVLQGLSTKSASSAAVLDSLSGQIYASAQALTFQQSQTVNKDLSNRLVMLGTLDNVGDKFGLWITGLGANGKLKQDGYGEGKTKVYGGQVGVDKQFGDNLILGTALSYSKANVKFNRYGGESDANNFGVSLYGRLGNKENPLYLQGRAGIGFVDSDVERDIILSSTDVSRAKINHNDKVISGYLETGYDFKNKKGDFVVTPFVGLSHDTVRRGSFSEDNSQFGLKADKKTYAQTSGLVGLRVGKSVDWKGGSKSTFQGYVTHQTALNNEDLSFDASYTGLSNAKFKVKGIGLPKNRTWVGVGALTEVNKNFGWYANYDGSVDSGKKGKGHNNVFTTGVRVNF